MNTLYTPKFIEMLSKHCRAQALTMPSGSSETEPCECQNWARASFLPLTNHHERCERYNDSLVDVWAVEYEGQTCYQDGEPGMEEHEGYDVKITKGKMHREVIDSLPEFEGF